jgi:hypothetical protein
MVTAQGPRAAARVWLLAGPVVFAIGVVLAAVSNALIWIGPIDRATFGWAIVVPMCLAAPVISGLAARWTGERAALVASWIAAASIAAFFIWTLAASIDRIGCAPADRAAVAAQAAPVGIAVGLTFAAAAWATLRLRRQLLLAIVVGLGTAILGGIGSLLVFAAQFGAASCVPGPS